jgi:hypothetical protein
MAVVVRRVETRNAPGLPSNGDNPARVFGAAQAKPITDRMVTVQLVTKVIDLNAAMIIFKMVSH